MSMVKRLFLLMIALAIVLAVAGGIYLVRSVRDMERIVAFGRRTEARYGDLARRIEWSPPPTGRLEAAARWEGWLQVRERLIAATPPELDDLAYQVLDEDYDPGLLGRIMLVRSIEPHMQDPIDAHLEALEEHRMSPLEYRWLTGMAIKGALARPERFAAGRAYGQLIDRLIVLGRGFVRRSALLDPGRIPDAGFVRRMIGEEFGEHPPPPDWALDRLDSRRESAYLFDLLVVAIEARFWTGREGAP